MKTTATTNINEFLFSRTQPAKKISVVNSMSDAELRAITPASVIKMIKEAEQNFYKSRDKRLYVSRSRRTGNKWNSDFNGVELIKGKLYVYLYCQGDDTDTDISDTYDNFFGRDDYRGTFYEANRYGDDVPHYAIYEEVDKIDAIRALALEYIYTKYASKLNTNQNKQ